MAVSRLRMSLRASKHPEHVDAGLGGQADELPDHVVGVVAVAHHVLAPQEHLQAGVGHGRLERAHPLPGVLVQEAHHGVEGGPAPHLQRPVSGSVELVGDGEHVLGAHARGQQRLVGVAQHDIGDVDRVLSLGVILVLFHLRFSCPYRGMLPCFFGRPPLTFGGAGFESGDQARPGLHRLDDVVDVAAPGGSVRRGELLPIVRHQFRPPRYRVLGFLELVAEDDVDGAFRSHDGYLGRGPGNVVVCADVLRAHDIVGAAISLAQDDRHLGHRRLAEGV